MGEIKNYEQLQVEETEHGYAVIKLFGRFLPGTDPDYDEVLRQTVKDLCDKGMNKIMINLHNVDYFASTFIGALMTCHVTAVKSNGSVLLFKPLNYVRQSLEMVKINTLVPIFDELADAEKFLGIKRKTEE